MAADEIREPRVHDRVLVKDQNGVLTVVDVDATARTVTAQFVTGDGPPLQNVSWTDLAYMDDQSGEDALEAAEEPDK